MAGATGGHEDGEHALTVGRPAGTVELAYALHVHDVDMPLRLAGALGPGRFVWREHAATDSAHGCHGTCAGATATATTTATHPAPEPLFQGREYTCSPLRREVPFTKAR